MLFTIKFIATCITLKIQKVVSKKLILEDRFTGNKTWKYGQLEKTVQRIYQFS